MKLELGVHRVCPACSGSGKRAAMTDADKRERERQLRLAKRQKVDPPPLVPSVCDRCGGQGWVYWDSAKVTSIAS